MFLDEPTTGLDPRSRNQVWEIVRALVGEGTTVLLCTQYLDEADQLADRIAVIDHGRVIAEGTPGQLKASVGQGTLHVRVLRARRARARAGGAVGWRSTRRCTSSPTRSRCRSPAPDPERAAEAVAALARRRTSSSRASRSASRRSTRCSSRSPATPPRREEEVAA